LRFQIISIANLLTLPPLSYVLIATVSTQKGETIYQSIMEKYRALAPIQLRERVQLRCR
jgi:hypothetical protein